MMTAVMLGGVFAIGWVVLHIIQQGDHWWQFEVLPLWTSSASIWWHTVMMLGQALAYSLVRNFLILNRGYPGQCYRCIRLIHDPE